MQRGLLSFALIDDEVVEAGGLGRGDVGEDADPRLRAHDEALVGEASQPQKITRRSASSSTARVRRMMSPVDSLQEAHVRQISDFVQRFWEDVDTAAAGLL